MVYKCKPTKIKAFRALHMQNTFQDNYIRGKGEKCN